MKKEPPEKVKLKDRMVKRRIREIKDEHTGSEIEYTTGKANYYTSAFSYTAYIAPVVITIISLVVSNIDVISDKWKFIIQFVAMIASIGLGLFFGWKEGVYRAVLNHLQTDTQVKNAKIEKLRNIIFSQNGEITFLLNLLNTLSKRIARDQTTMSELANFIAVQIYSDCQRRFGNDFEVTVNIYEQYQNTISMVGHHQQTPYHDTPALYLCGHQGMEINAEPIKNFYCVNCIQGRNDLNVLSDWKEIVDAFDWTGATKEELKKSKEACREHGFTYNQYASFRSVINRAHNHVLLLELITHNESTIHNKKMLKDTARKLFSVYMPLVMMLCSIATDGKVTVE